MLEEAKNMGETPTASMYNVIIHGYFREVCSSMLCTLLLSFSPLIIELNFNIPTTISDYIVLLVT